MKKIDLKTLARLRVKAEETGDRDLERRLAMRYPAVHRPLAQDIRDKLALQRAARPKPPPPSTKKKTTKKPKRSR